MPSSVVLGGTTYYTSTAPIPPAASAVPTVPVSHAAYVQIPSTQPATTPLTGAIPPLVPQGGISFQDLIEVMKIGRKGPLPEWNLSKYDGDPLQWSEWYGQFKSAVDSALLSDHEKLTYLKTLVTGKAKLAIADVSYSGEFY